MASLLTDFIVQHDFIVCDLSYCVSVKFTYERDDGLVNSRIDHVVCSQSLSLCATDVHTVVSRNNLSDHLPTSPAPQSLCRHLLLRWRFRLVIMKLPDIPKPI